MGAGPGYSGKIGWPVDWADDLGHDLGYSSFLGDRRFPESEGGET